MSWSALCDPIAATQLLPTTLYSDLNIADNPQPQSLALLVSFVWNALFKLFFGLSPSTGLSSDDICSLAYVIILYRISNHPPPTSTQTFGISQALHLIFSKAFIYIYIYMYICAYIYTYIHTHSLLSVFPYQNINFMIAEIIVYFIHSQKQPSGIYCLTCNRCIRPISRLIDYANGNVVHLSIKQSMNLKP